MRSPKEEEGKQHTNPNKRPFNTPQQHNPTHKPQTQQTHEKTKNGASHSKEEKENFGTVKNTIVFAGRKEGKRKQEEKREGKEKERRKGTKQENNKEKLLNAKDHPRCKKKRQKERKTHKQEKAPPENIRPININKNKK